MCPRGKFLVLCSLLSAVSWCSLVALVSCVMLTPVGGRRSCKTLCHRVQLKLCKLNDRSVILSPLLPIFSYTVQLGDSGGVSYRARGGDQLPHRQGIHSEFVQLLLDTSIFYRSSHIFLFSDLKKYKNQPFNISLKANHVLTQPSRRTEMIAFPLFLFTAHPFSQLQSSSVHSVFSNGGEGQERDASAQCCWSC